MKILHTADWHIGKVLHKHALRDELILFFDWLYDLIQVEAIDLLLVSGDIFDLANPAVKDRELYYQFLSRLIQLQIRVIITGGNHDAVGLLNAPKQILNQLNISVVGGAKENIEDELITIKNEEGEIELIVAAVPFLRDKDLRSKETDTKFANRTEAIREGIKEHYKELAEICDVKYAGLPVIAMGHLYAEGSLTSDSERDIHVGNAAAIESSIFSSTFNYVALGHIHRPQIVGKNRFIRYSGSPIALSFSEKTDEKCLIIVELEDGEIREPQVIEVPKFRELKKFSGDYNYIAEELANYNPEFELESFVEIEVKEQQFNVVTLGDTDHLIEGYNTGPFKILKSRVIFEEGVKDSATLFTEGDHIEDLRPIDVFTKLLFHQSIDSEKHELLKEAFMEIAEEASQTDES